MIAPVGERRPAKAPLTSDSLQDRIFVHHDHKLVKIFIKDIQYVRAERAYCRIVTGRKSYLLSVSLGALERQLPTDRLLRCHRSFLVNLRWVDAIEDGCLTVGKSCIQVSRSHRPEIERHLCIIR